MAAGQNKPERSWQKTDSGCGSHRHLPEHERRDDSHKEETDDLDKHVTASVNTREAVPVPIGNVGRDGGQDPGNENEADSAGEVRDARLSEQEHDKDGFEQLGAEFNSEQFAKCERSTRRMVHENARRVRRDFFAHVFHRFILFLAALRFCRRRGREKYKDRSGRRCCFASN